MPDVEMKKLTNFFFLPKLASERHRCRLPGFRISGSRSLFRFRIKGRQSDQPDQFREVAAQAEQPSPHADAPAAVSAAKERNLEEQELRRYEVKVLRVVYASDFIVRFAVGL
jgi:hypothetical protein